MKDNITNVYSRLPKEYLSKDKVPNPSFKKHLIEDPISRFLLIGPSGSGKTQILVEMLSRMNNTYWHVYLVCPNTTQTLYKYISDKLGDGITICPSMAELGPAKELEPIGKPKLVIFDDLITSNKATLKLISDFFVAGRHSQCACIFLTQSFFDTPKILRLNCNYIMLRRIGNNRDLAFIIKTYAIKDIDKESLSKIYQYSTDGSDPNFLMLDLNKPDQMFRRDFLEILDPKDFGFIEK